MTSDYATTRERLLKEHAEARRRRDAAEHGSDAHRKAIAEVGRIEVELARVARDQDPPLV